MNAQMYKEAGVPSTSFTGVPVFQAQGLTVKTEKSRYTPLFLAKEDLDVAVGAAFSQRESAREAATRNKAAAAEDEVESARTAVRHPPSPDVPQTSCRFTPKRSMSYFCRPGNWTFAAERLGSWFACVNLLNL